MKWSSDPYSQTSLEVRTCSLGLRRGQEVYLGKWSCPEGIVLPIIVQTQAHKDKSVSETARANQSVQDIAVATSSVLGRLCPDLEAPHSVHWLCESNRKNGSGPFPGPT